MMTMPMLRIMVTRSEISRGRRYRAVLTNDVVLKAKIRGIDGDAMQACSVSHNTNANV